MSPYRTPATSHEPVVEEDRRDDCLLGAIMIALGGWRVVLALLLDESFGVESTIAAIMTGLGVLLLITSLARR